jgi:hypothetical protein
MDCPSKLKLLLMAELSPAEAVENLNKFPNICPPFFQYLKYAERADIFAPGGVNSDQVTIYWPRNGADNAALAQLRD